MSETTQPAPDKKELPKWDRSPEGVHNAVGRIGKKLAERAAKLSHIGSPEANTGQLWYDTSNQKAVRGMVASHSTVVTHEDLHDAYLGRELETTSGGNSLRQWVQSNRGAGKYEDVDIKTNPSKVSARKSGAYPKIEGLDPSLNLTEVTTPAAVGLVAAHLLNGVRGDIAEAEIHEEKKNAQTIIDAINNPEFKK